MSEKLDELRREIDKLDELILSLLKKRVELAKKMGKIKQRLNLPIIDEERESEVKRHISLLAERYELDKGDVAEIYRGIVALCRKAQGEIQKVAYLGPEGTFTEEAAIKFFHKVNTVFIPCVTIDDVFRKVESNESNYGVVPIENSLEGSIGAVLDNLLAYNLYVYGEVNLPIVHNLIVKPGTKMENIDTIISHPQALLQCRAYIERKFPRAKIIEVESTAKAVFMLREMKNAAAIGSELAAKLYNMEILEKGIQNSARNYTRFFVLSRKPHRKTGHDKTSVVFAVKHIPGALYKALREFAKRKINLTKIESRPSKQKPWEYYFFVDFEGHIEDGICLEAVKALEKKTTYLRVLGSYPVWRGQA